jgi:hypothetical protein
MRTKSNRNPSMRSREERNPSLHQVLKPSVNRHQIAARRFDMSLITFTMNYHKTCKCYFLEAHQIAATLVFPSSKINTLHKQFKSIVMVLKRKQGHPECSDANQTCSNISVRNHCKTGK